MRCLARMLGKRIGEELGIPVYAYENAATSEIRRNLAKLPRRRIRSAERQDLICRLEA